MNIVTKLAASLNELSDLQAKKDVLRIKRDEELDAILTDEQREKVGQIEAYYNTGIDATNVDITMLTDSVKQGILAHGSTVRGSFLMAVRIKGRVSWNSKGLEGFMVAHPEIKAFRKEGKPSCTIRKI